MVSKDNSVLHIFTKWLIFLCCWFFLFPTLESLMLLYFKYFPLHWLFFSAHIFSILKHTYALLLTIWSCGLSSYFSFWQSDFSGPRQTWVQILAEWLTKCMLLSRFSHVWLCVTPWTAAYQASPSMGFSRQEHWSGVIAFSLLSAWLLAIFLISLALVTSSVNGDNNSTYPIGILRGLNAHSKCSINDKYC